MAKDIVAEAPVVVIPMDFSAQICKAKAVLKSSKVDKEIFRIKQEIVTASEKGLLALSIPLKTTNHVLVIKEIIAQFTMLGFVIKESVATGKVEFLISWE